ncbi:NADH-cytochrome b5 reductase 2 [Scheffersomyces amazonensis]|uniref:NADH-cytochrome b5 reductase 2 n=1 Tax=Scheffersomyces amazonensis TaxID=1078765 RepID=UPI00315CE611
MSFVSRLSKIATNPKLFVPILASAASIGLAMSFSSQTIANEGGKTFKGGDEWIDLKLIKSVDLSHDTKHLYFALPNKDDVSGLITASLLLTKFVTPKGSNVIRPYTPVSDNDQTGVIEFIVKKYDNGKASTHIHELKPNDTLSFKGPIVKWKWEPNQFKNISLIGGGTGITPFYQLIHEVTKNPADKTKIDLFYGSISESDILLRKELDELAAKHKDQLKIHYFLDKAPTNWNGQTGFINKEYLSKHLPAPGKDNKIYVCGPPGLYKAISGPKVSPTDQGDLSGALAELGYSKEEVFKF